MTGRRRLALAVAGLFALLAISGCLSPVSDADLKENATYNWESNASASYTLYTNNYTAVLDVNNRSSIELFLEDAFGSNQALPISALQFRYPNGTVVNNTAFSVETGRSKVTLEPPARNGTAAFTVARSGPDFRTPVVVSGSHEVHLPPGRAISLPFISRAVPGNYTTQTVDDRVVVKWGSVERETILLSFYRNRDVLLFGGLAGVVVAIGLVGLAYHRRQISRLEAQREQLGLDVDTEDDDPRDRGPPPGMG
ncbi:hypothetical protein Hrd1104_05745 [Halorhabdus sp. CBA1104]|uniref:DUF5803 family protein n=1 Tax=Halorhabdus sp. CBA1104 TaxID=1380432 RepID=UPI0012B3AA4C|nr:DUF5803 family protein [Halorhabdus sp. CBA1104]QGN06844.1 hypothetical protein Hrd1104_05745 [Halorhabdus sp. CBA1104]